MLIVIPVYKRHGLFKRCIDSVIKDLNKSKSPHKLVIVNNGSDDDIRDYIQHKIFHFHKASVILINTPINVGKACAVNEAVKTQTYPKMDTLCSFDSDLEIYSKNFFDNLEMTYKIARETYKINILCAEQIGNTCHKYNKIRNKRFINGEQVLYNRRGNGIAGGCLVVDWDLFGRVGGYRTNTGIFGGNDGHLMQDIGSTLKDSYVGLATREIVIHPHVEDLGYEEWKVMATKKIQETGYGVSKGYWD